MSSYMAKTDADSKPINFEQQWFVIDATDQVVGRLVTPPPSPRSCARQAQAAIYTPSGHRRFHHHHQRGQGAVHTGRKLEQKTYQTYSHYPGGQRIIAASELMEKYPERIIVSAVKRMVPRNRLGRAQMEKLKIYRGNQHPHQAQQPKEFKPK